MRASTGVFALMATTAVFLSTPVSAGSPGDVFTDPDGQWFVSVQGGLASFEASRSVRDAFSGDHDFTSSFHDNAIGALRFGRRSGNWDMAIGIGGGNFNARGDSFNAYGDTVSSPFGELDSSSSEIANSIDDAAHFINGNLEIGYSPAAEPGEIQTRVFAGLQFDYMKWNREAGVNITSSNGFFGDESSQFYGAGPRIGGSFQAPFAAGSTLSLFGGIAGGVMIGSLKHQLKGEFDELEGLSGDISTKSETDTVVVPFASGEFGLSFAMTANASVQAGYQVSFRGGIIRNNQLCDSSSCSDTKRGDVVTHGPFLRLSMAF